MTWFITEWDEAKRGNNKYTIVGVDEFRNDAYFSELNINKQNTVSYHIFENTNPCKGFNDGSYYVTEDGKIKWRSCEITILPPPPETFEVGSLNNPYVFSMSADNEFMQKFKEVFVVHGNKLDILLEKLGYTVVFIGFNPLTANGDYPSGDFEIGFIKKGSEPISLTLILLIGIIAIALIFISYNVRFIIKDYMNGKILIAREDTTQAYYDGLKSILESPFTTDEQKKEAAEKLGEPPPLPPIKPPINGNGSGIGTGLTIGVVVLAAVLFFLLYKRK